MRKITAGKITLDWKYVDLATAVREAIATERSARKELPPDARGLVVIMAEIGRGGLTAEPRVASVSSWTRPAC